MNATVFVIFLFGVFSLVGGLIGYIKADSMPSLIAGSISGVILLFCSYGILKGNQLAAIVTLVVALLLGGRFLLTIIKNFKLMPDFLMILFSLLTIILVIQHLLKK
ncbi:MAG: hypothetical protein A2Y94_13075 [Caldithrix sp. RBG_13_44_9]|nr:MAG: hypothetical protein A2Y94_13075 [Caldithrix sp. RBG_13_44_9]